MFLLYEGTVHLHDRDFSPLVAVKGHFMLHVTQAFARLKQAYVVV